MPASRIQPRTSSFDRALLGRQEDARQAVRLLGMTRERLAAIVDTSSVDHGRKLSDGGTAACASR